jgi:hypothetical protein
MAPPVSSSESSKMIATKITVQSFSTTPAHICLHVSLI